MRFRSPVSVVIYIAQVFGDDPTSSHLPISGHGFREEVAVVQNHSASDPLPQVRRFDLEHEQSDCVSSSNHTRQYCAFADPHFDHGKGVIVITTPERAQHFFKFSASTSNHRSSIREPLFKTKTGGGKGRGVFASRHIPAGTLITQESPILFIDQNWTQDIPSEDARTTLQASAVKKLPESTRRTVEELYGGSNKIMTNSYGITGGPTKDWPGLENESDLGITTVHANISKVNHGCRANASPQWDWNGLAHNLYAVRDIAADEEITMSYFDTRQTFRERQEYTNQTLGFQCACSHCRATSNFIDLSDDRVNEINLLERYLENRQIAPADSTAMAELLVDLYEQEGLDSFISKAYAIAALEWNGTGHEYRARSWAYRSVKAGLVASQVAGVEEYMEDMQALLDGARKHWSWKYRVS
ncbi:lysine methyltransferase [Venturia nashicola]|nr:lysine methyltransferase [Venturia nashicola]